MIFNIEQIPEHLKPYFEPAPEIGSEPTPEAFVAKMVEVFREVRRVLRDDGTLWLNLGDTYAGGAGNGTVQKGLDIYAREVRGQNDNGPKQADRICGSGRSRGIPAGNLIGIPWRVALALQADGWILRQDIIWAKPSPMPESVRNRCTKAHEYVFLFAKRQGYFYDAEAIKEQSIGSWNSSKGFTQDGKNNDFHQETGMGQTRGIGTHHDDENKTGRNKRSVWNVSSQPYPGAHFATYPPKLIEPCILAGTSAHGCCSGCGAPYKRVVEETKLTRERPNDFVKYAETRGIKSGLNKDRGDGGRSNVGGNSCANSVAGVEVKTVGWQPSCKCFGHSVVPCTVLDPFLGSGTTAIVCIEHGRRAVGIDLSKQYLDVNAIPRIQGELLSRPALAWLVRKAIERMDVNGTNLLGS